MSARRAKILHEGRWKEHPYHDLREGDVVSFVEADGEPVDAGRIFIVTEGYNTSDPLLTVQVVPAGRS